MDERDKWVIGALALVAIVLIIGAILADTTKEVDKFLGYAGGCGVLGVVYLILS
jgi:hypothetical protein